MDTHQHPEDERLAALAGGEPDASADDRLRGHVAACSRCQELVHDLTVLRSALAELPDLVPARQLELRLPPPRVGTVERLAAFSRRAFAPVMGVAAALLLVGVIGTGADIADQLGAAPAPAADGAPAMAPDAADDYVRHQADEEAPGAAAEREDAAHLEAADDELGVARVAAEGTQAVVEGWPWNALLVAGLALMILALVLRFTLRPKVES